MLTVVSGPPCGGKSTFVRENAQPNDIIIDMDRIALALSHESITNHDYPAHIRAVARSAREGARKKALEYAQGDRRINVWLIETSPSPANIEFYRILGARFVLQSPGLEECLRRLKTRPLANQLLVERVIREYYANR